GRALKFYSSVRLEVRRAETLKQGTDMVGNKTRLNVVKNKVAPPFKQAMVDIMYGEGISHEGEIHDMGAEIDVVEKSGAWYSYEGERIRQGRKNAKKFLRENKEIAEQIHKVIRDNYTLDETSESGETDAEENTPNEQLKI